MTESDIAIVNLRLPKDLDSSLDNIAHIAMAPKETVIAVLFAVSIHNGMLKSGAKDDTTIST